MHSPDLSLEDAYAVDSLNKMVSFLETVKHGMKEKYDDNVIDCEAAIADIKKVSSCRNVADICCWSVSDFETVT